MLWLLLGLLFVAPFIDPRRPLRLLHLDLITLVVVGFILIRVRTVGAPMEEYHVGIVLLAIGLLYLLVRMLVLGFRPRGPKGQLVPLVPLTWLLVAVIGLVCFRVAYVKFDHHGVVDVGVVSAEGAARIADGRGLYGPWSNPDGHGDTYGPVNYLVYLPFERAATWSGREGYQSYALAARMAAITFDLLTLIGLFLLGRRLRPREGNALGLALAFAWASCPYTLFVLKFGSNDGLVALLLVAVLLALGSAPLRGAITALAAMTKFAPGAVAPLFATAADERRGRSVLVFAGSFLLVSAASLLPFLPDGDIRELYDRTVGYQAGREVGSTVWWLFPELEPLQPAARVAAVGLALAVAVIPARRGPVQVAALAAAVIIAFELTVTFWWPPYFVWFAPLVFVALFAAYAPEQPFARTGSTAKGRRAAAGVSQS